MLTSDAMVSACVIYLQFMWRYTIHQLLRSVITFTICTYICNILIMLSPRHCASSGFGRKRRPPDVEIKVNSLTLIHLSNHLKSFKQDLVYIEMQWKFFSFVVEFSWVVTLCNVSVYSASIFRVK